MLRPHIAVGKVVFQLRDAYREHQMLWKIFESDPDARRDFLYRREIRQGRPVYYILSQRKPVDDAGIWQIDPPKPFHPKLRTGQRLAFMLRVNPVIVRDGKRHDIVMDFKKRKNWQGLPPDQRPPMDALIREAGIEWLQKRAEKSGFAFDARALRVDGYLQHVAYRGATRMRFSTLDYTGVLEVKDPDLFMSTVQRGLGKSKAFGCGLFLLKRV